MIHADKTYYFSNENIVTNRFMKWIELEVPEIMNDDESNAYFDWRFHPSKDFGNTSVVLFMHVIKGLR